MHIFFVFVIFLGPAGYAFDREHTHSANDPFVLARSLKREGKAYRILRPQEFFCYTEYGTNSEGVGAQLTLFFKSFLRVSGGFRNFFFPDLTKVGSVTFGPLMASSWYGNISYDSLPFGRQLSEVLMPQPLKKKLGLNLDLRSLFLSCGGSMNRAQLQGLVTLDTQHDLIILGNIQLKQKKSFLFRKSLLFRWFGMNHWTCGGGIGYIAPGDLLFNYYHQLHFVNGDQWVFEYIKARGSRWHTEYNVYFLPNDYAGMCFKSFTLGGEQVHTANIYRAPDIHRAFMVVNVAATQPWVREHISLSLGVSWNALRQRPEPMVDIFLRFWSANYPR